jgi:hypothetical protein
MTALIEEGSTQPPGRVAFVASLLEQAGNYLGLIAARLRLTAVTTYWLGVL